MPTVLRVEGFRLFFFSNEGTEPPHVHIERGEGYCKYWLEPIELASSTGFKAPELRRIGEIVAENRRTIKERWNEHFGD